MEGTEKLLQELIRAQSIEEMTEIAEANGMNADRATMEELYAKIKSEEASLRGAQGELGDEELDGVNGGAGLFSRMNGLMDWFSNFCAARLFGKTGSNPTLTILPATQATTATVTTMEQRGFSTARVTTMEGRGKGTGKVVTGVHRSGTTPGNAKLL